MKISRLFGQKIYTDGDEGVILGIDFAEGRIAGFIIADGSLNERYACAKDVTLGKKIVCRKTTKKPALINGLKLGRAAFDEEGNFVGYLKDVEAHGFELVSARIGNASYPFSQIAAGDAVIVHGRTLAAMAAKDMFIGALCSTDEGNI